MSEIEKMMQNAGIKKVKDYYCPNCETKLEDWFGKHKEYICPNERCDYALCDDEEDFQECLEHLSYREKYPPFTAEKQIAILQFCLKWGQVHILKGIDNEYRIENSCYRQGYQPTIADAIADYINEKWEKLTPEEKQQVKGILE